jgi:hypothetical protein
LEPGRGVPDIDRCLQIVEPDPQFLRRFVVDERWRVFASIHNIAAEALPENIAAPFAASLEFGLTGAVE